MGWGKKQGHAWRAWHQEGGNRAFSTRSNCRCMGEKKDENIEKYNALQFFREGRCVVRGKYQMLMLCPEWHLMWSSAVLSNYVPQLFCSLLTFMVRTSALIFGETTLCFHVCKHESSHSNVNSKLLCILQNQWRNVSVVAITADGCVTYFWHC